MAREWSIEAQTLLARKYFAHKPTVQTSATDYAKQWSRF